MIKIGQASRDERGKYSGGIAGDQDGREVAIREWYNRPWNKVLRCKDAGKAEKIATAMEAACKNNYIGYDQNQRHTLYELCKTNGWNIEAIKTPCETDCSALVAVCVNAAGIKISGNIYTGNQAAALLKTGEFELLSAPKYLITDEYLKRGDILLYEFHHTAIAMQDGGKAEKARTNPVEYPLGWNKNKEGKWWYADAPNSYISGKWALIDGRWYVFDNSGYMIAGWFKSNEDWYYLNKDDGTMLSGQWILDNNKSYYLSKSGIMAKNCYVKSKEKDVYYWIGENGEWNSKFDTYTPNLKDHELVE